MQINKCCGVTPTVHEADEDSRSGYDAITCYICGFTVFGCDEDSIKDWNDGVNNEEGSDVHTQ